MGNKISQFFILTLQTKIVLSGCPSSPPEALEQNTYIYKGGPGSGTLEITKTFSSLFFYPGFISSCTIDCIGTTDAPLTVDDLFLSVTVNQPSYTPTIKITLQEPTSFTSEHHYFKTFYIQCSYTFDRIVRTITSKPI
jgi:hypothetical protein